MKIIIKNSIKNIFKKPLRTLLMTFTVFMCVLSALFCIDIGQALGKLVEEIYGNVATADLMIESQKDIVLPEDMPEHESLMVYVNKETVYTDYESEVAFFDEKQFLVYGIDINKAYDMKFVDFGTLSDNETVINNAMATHYGYKAGDKIIIHDRASEEHEFTIKDIMPSGNTNPLMMQGDIAIVNQNANDILSCGIKDHEVLLVDITDGSNTDKTIAHLKDELPRTLISSLELSKEDAKSLSDIKFFMYIVFAVSFLLVIFVTISISERIVSERMSFIGTLRSLGMSIQRTCSILLLENIIYAFLGAIPATLLYLSTREGLMSSLMMMQTADGEFISVDVGPISILLVVAVFIGALLVECLVPLRSVAKALKTSIRDIIFDNRDTEYKLSKKMSLTGAGLAIVAVVCGVFSSKLIMALICIVSAVAAIALLFPLIFIKICEGLKKLFERIGSQKWVLAASEARSRKSTVGSGIMCVTASALCVVIFAVGMAELNSLVYTKYKFDVTVDCSGKASMYSFIDHIDGVTQTEKVYFKGVTANINDSDMNAYTEIYGMPEGGFTMFTDTKGLPEKLEKGSVCVSKRMAGIENIKAGDTIKVTVEPEGVIPFVREYNVAAIFEGSGTVLNPRTLVVSEEEYIDLFHDVPGRILIQCDDPEMVSEVIKTYGNVADEDCKTAGELVAEAQGNSLGLVSIIGIVIAMGIGITLIGVISNQIIGFEGRKKECAVMLSTAMNKRTLSGILLREAFLVSTFAGSLGTLSGVALARVFANAIDHTESIIMQIDTEPIECLIFCIMLIFVFTFTVLFPIKNLRKMKIAEQIKYE